MRYDERLLNQKRHELWTELCELADQLLELSARWWEVDSDLVDAHYQRCRIRNSNLEFDFDKVKNISNDDF